MKVIDIHTHGIDGYDTRSATEDDILKIAEIQGSHGVSEILLTIYPSTIKVMRDNMEIVKKAMDKQRSSASGGISDQQSGISSQKLEVNKIESSELKTQDSNPPLPPLLKGGRRGYNLHGS